MSLPHPWYCIGSSTWESRTMYLPPLLRPVSCINLRDNAYRLMPQWRVIFHARAWHPSWVCIYIRIDKVVLCIYTKHIGLLLTLMATPGRGIKDDKIKRLNIVKRNHYNKGTKYITSLLPVKTLPFLPQICKSTVGKLHGLTSVEERVIPTSVILRWLLKEAHQSPLYVHTSR